MIPVRNFVLGGSKHDISNGGTEITLGHGSGGRLMHKLIDEVILAELSNPALDKLTDSAILNINKERIAFTTDSYVVTPLFFPGSDIGKLAVYGTANDLAVCGARPLFISAGVIAEEGLRMDVFRKVIRSMRQAASLAGVKIVTGDIKVVERGKCDGLYINTSGIGIIKRDTLCVENIKIGDKVIISGSIGDHGISVLSAREGINISGSLKSDTAPLYNMLSGILKIKGLRFMRDPTRGGIAATLNEIVKLGRFGILLDEKNIFLKPDVYAACELLGLDPLYVANEGKAVIIVSEKDAVKVLKLIRRDKLGRNARMIGEVTKEHKGRVVLKTKVGGMRIVDMPASEHLPRIC